MPQRPQNAGLSPKRIVAARLTPRLYAWWEEIKNRMSHRWANSSKPQLGKAFTKSFGLKLSQLLFQSKSEYHPFSNPIICQTLAHSIPMPNQQTKKRVTLQVSGSLHKRIKELSREREETMMELMLTALQKFITTEPTQGSRIGLLQKWKEDKRCRS